MSRGSADESQGGKAHDLDHGDDDWSAIRRDCDSMLAGELAVLVLRRFKINLAEVFDKQILPRLEESERDMDRKWEKILASVLYIVVH